jgi:Zn-dependent peptidase ImmA (M78 family)/DNA-binding XRE family transcriptional regulator
MAPLKAIGKNLQNARKSLGMTQAEVSSVLGISRSAISLIELGKRQVNSAELARLANLYHKTISELLDPEAVSTPDGFAMLFRAEEVSKEDRVQIAEFEDLCKRYSVLEKRVYGSVEWRIPLYKEPSPHLSYHARRHSVETIASEERYRLGLGIAPIKDIFSLLEKQGVRIFKLRLKSRISGGFTYSESLGPCILVNANHGIRTVFTAAHEYFHCLVDRDIIATICREDGRGRQPKRESMANHFAACFLMPRESLTESYYRYTDHGYGVTGTDIIFLSRDFGVSYSAMLTRLRDLKLITDSECYELEKIRPEKMAEENGLAPRQLDLGPMPGRYVYMATRLYFQEEISIGKLAEYLKKSIIEVQSFVKNLREQLIVEEIFEIA